MLGMIVDLSVQYIHIWFYFFSESSKLSKREKIDLEYKRKVLTLAKDHRNASEMEKVNRYFIPKDDVVSVFFLLFCHHFQVWPSYICDKDAMSNAWHTCVWQRSNEYCVTLAACDKYVMSIAWHFLITNMLQHWYKFALHWLDYYHRMGNEEWLWQELCCTFAKILKAFSPDGIWLHCLELLATFFWVSLTRPDRSCPILAQTKNALGSKA